ncbi:MAG: NUDIX domain-containing protein [Bacilli bacterium]|nr:NUDIX domain-containing protein [Bacilli bacterium]
MKEYKQLGAYGIVIKEDNILLIKKFGGPYGGKLDLPGGTIEFCERPSEALKRELLEEVGIEVVDYELFDADSVSFEWQYKEDELIKVHHTGIFFKINNFNNEIKREVEVDEINDDSQGAEFYNINELSKESLSQIALLELEKLGYKIND